VGAAGHAPVLVYAPSLPRLLPPGHPGRAALEMLQPTEGDSWLDCVLPLPPDHALCGSTVGQVLGRLESRDSKAYGHGHATERLVSAGTMGGNVSQAWVHAVKPPPVAGGKKRKAADSAPALLRPIIGANGVLEWDDASSALQYGTVAACIPAAEAALELLLPPSHPALKTQLAPFGRVFTYQAGKWYVSREAAAMFPGLTKFTRGGAIDSFEEESGAARTIEPHFDTGNNYLWGLCIIFGEFSGFEQVYPTIRVLLECGHLSFAAGPYGQLCHAVAQGTATSGPRLCVLLHVHGEMTTMPGAPALEYSLTGFAGCPGEQPIEGGECVCDVAMGFEPSRTAKSEARVEMEMLMRRLPRRCGEGFTAPSPAELRARFVDLCVRGLTSQAAPLLGDAVLLTAMTEDYRRGAGAGGGGERSVREALLRDLEAGLEERGYPASDTQWRKHADHLACLPA
jgi:hypothetical protein